VPIGTVTETNGILTWNVGTLTTGADARWFITVLPIGTGTFTNNISFRGGSGLAVFDLPSSITVLPSAPTLGVRLVGGQVEIFWSTNYGSFHLQRASSLSGSSQWNDLTNTPATSGGFYRVTVGASVSSKYFRLVKP